MSKRLPIAGTPAAPFCKQCGECCKGTPGAYAPEDFFDDDEKVDLFKIEQMLEDGQIVLGIYDGDPRYAGDSRIHYDAVSVVYYPLPPYKRRKDGPVDNRMPFGLGGCSRLTDRGCELEFENRPFGCRTLVPIHHEGKFLCRQPFDGMSDKQYVALQWLEYIDDFETICKTIESRRSRHAV